DGTEGDKAKCKRLYKIDLAGASDVSERDALPAEELPEGMRPVKKSLFLDLLDPRYGIRGPECPEKFEGLAFGPDLPDGRRLLVVACDNDFEADKPMILYAFAVDRSDLPGFGWSLGGSKASAGKK
ncbi:MAG TPA: esterase-like activity of phytase family protein, partial [Pirellulales bacterium]|nr:esterase-like activity of phytase family protein [Pirellulales bacterium]